MQPNESHMREALFQLIIFIPKPQCCLNPENHGMTPYCPVPHPFFFGICRCLVYTRPLLSAFLMSCHSTFVAKRGMVCWIWWQNFLFCSAWFWGVCHAWMDLFWCQTLTHSGHWYRKSSEGITPTAQSKPLPVNDPTDCVLTAFFADFDVTTVLSCSIVE